MGLNFTGKKSDLTGLCEILNNFDLRFQKNSQKSEKTFNDREYFWAQGNNF